MLPAYLLSYSQVKLENLFLALCFKDQDQALLKKYSKGIARINQTKKTKLNSLLNCCINLINVYLCGKLYQVVCYVLWNFCQM